LLAQLKQMNPFLVTIISPPTSTQAQQRASAGALPGGSSRNIKGTKLKITIVFLKYK